MQSAESPALETDESLMLRYGAGDITAFDTLYGRHELGVWRFVFRSVRVQAVADDLLQDVWFAVARQALNYQPTARFKTWLFTLAHNRLVDYFRTAKNHMSLDAQDTADDAGERVLDTLIANSGFGPLAPTPVQAAGNSPDQRHRELAPRATRGISLAGRSRHDSGRNRQCHGGEL
jgi:RNA polymerase sigma factor (sigma-70 family)